MMMMMMNVCSKSVICQRGSRMIRSLMKKKAWRQDREYRGYGTTSITHKRKKNWGRCFGTSSLMDKHYQLPMKGSEVDRRVGKELDSLGFSRENTLYVESSCPDEISKDNKEEDLSLILAERFGSVFQLGGLGGLPFVGPTGWQICTSHVPDDGNIFLMYASQVGFDAETGRCGEVRRAGQKDNLSTSCGASIAALSALKENPNSEPDGMIDHQFGIIKQLLQPSLSDVLNEDPDEEMINLSFAMYHVIRLYLEQIITIKKPKNKIAILGGIMIHQSEVGADLFQPLSFELRDGNGNKTDLCEKTFGVSHLNLISNKKKS